MKHCGSELKVHWDSSEHVCFPSLPSHSRPCCCSNPGLLLASSVNCGRSTESLQAHSLMCKETLFSNTSWRGRFLEGHFLSQVLIAYSQSWPLLTPGAPASDLTIVRIRPWGPFIPTLPPSSFLSAPAL